MNYFRKCCFETLPDYDAVNKLLDCCIKKRGISQEDPYDWEIWQQKVALILKDLPSFTAIQLKDEKTDQKENVIIDLKKKLTEKFDEALLQITPPTTQLSEGILLQMTQLTEFVN